MSTPEVLCYPPESPISTLHIIMPLNYYNSKAQFRSRTSGYPQSYCADISMVFTLYG